MFINLVINILAICFGACCKNVHLQNIGSFVQYMLSIYDQYHNDQKEYKFLLDNWYPQDK